MPRNNFILALHSTYDNFGFAYKEINEVQDKPKIFTRKFEKNLTNNIIYDLREFLPTRSFNEIERISISLGPANFNASRLIVVLARTISQQINCSLDSYSSFKLMAKRIAIKNKHFRNNESFWVTKKLKNRGYLCGKYQISWQNKVTIKELIKPDLFLQFPEGCIHFEVDENIKDDLQELIFYSIENHKDSVTNKWEDVLPIYPFSPTN